MESIDHMVGTVLSHLADAATSRTVAGEPIVLGDVRLVVLSMVTLGMGAGGGEGQGEAGNNKAKTKAGPGAGSGEGAGGGAKVRPAAVIAFTPTGVQVHAIPGQPGVFEKVVERVPAMMDVVEKARQAFE